MGPSSPLCRGGGTAQTEAGTSSWHESVRDFSWLGAWRGKQTREEEGDLASQQQSKNYSLHHLVFCTEEPCRRAGCFTSPNQQDLLLTNTHLQQPPPTTRASTLPDCCTSC